MPFIPCSSDRAMKGPIPDFLDVTLNISLICIYACDTLSLLITGRHTTVIGFS